MGAECRYSFADLFRAAHGRDWSDDEKRAFEALDHDARNAWVRSMTALTAGRFVTDDRMGTDGRTYAAFRAVW
jgi:hypothetical protein